MYHANLERGYDGMPLAAGVAHQQHIISLHLMTAKSVIHSSHQGDLHSWHRQLHRAILIDSITMSHTKSHSISIPKNLTIAKLKS
jgi:hypothetical protein